jgi:murein DD-endopeptidase MepM/ murein hydrolase activator NlpD
MSQRVTSRSSRTSQLRTRATVLAAGLGVSVALGAGVASAADTTAASGAASAVQAQAAAQAKAAKAEAVKAEKAAKSAAAQKAAEKKAAAEKAAAKKATPSWVDPVKKYKLSASFAQNGGMWQSTHSGQDFAVPSGTVVKAGGNGAGDGPAYGNAVVIKHGNGTYSQYAHLSKVTVRIGQIVKTGQEIAKSGNTGNSSGPHLHFEIRTTPNYGSAVDPVKFLRAKGVTV